MSRSPFLKLLRFFLWWTCFIGVVVVGLYYVFDPVTPKIFKLLITLGIFGFVLVFFMGGGGGKGGPLGGKAPPASWGA